MLNSATELFLTNYFYIASLVGNFLTVGKGSSIGLQRYSLCRVRRRKGSIKLRIAAR